MKKVFITLTTFFTLSIFVFPVQAQNNLPENIQERREQQIEARCTSATELIDRLTKRYDEKHADHVDSYNKIRDRVNLLVSKLKEKGYDTSELEKDLQILNNRILEFNDHHTDFQASLNESKTYACGNSQGEFKATLEEAKGNLKKMRETAKEITTFIRNDLRSDIQELKNQKPTPTE